VSYISYKPFTRFDFAEQLHIVQTLRDKLGIKDNLSFIMDRLNESTLEVHKRDGYINCIGFTQADNRYGHLNLPGGTKEPAQIWDKELWEKVLDCSDPIEKSFTLRMFQDGEFHALNSQLLKGEARRGRVIYSIVRTSNEKAQKFTEYNGFVKVCTFDKPLGARIPHYLNVYLPSVKK
jgi:hypothetical protein